MWILYYRWPYSSPNHTVLHTCSRMCMTVLQCDNCTKTFLICIWATEHATTCNRLAGATSAPMLAVVHCSYHISSHTHTRQDVVDLSGLLHTRLMSGGVLFWGDLLQTEWLAMDLILGVFFVPLKIRYIRVACLERYYHMCCWRQRSFSYLFLTESFH